MLLVPQPSKMSRFLHTVQAAPTSLNNQGFHTKITPLTTFFTCMLMGGLFLQGVFCEGKTWAGIYPTMNRIPDASENTEGDLIRPEGRSYREGSLVGPNVKHNDIVIMNDNKSFLSREAKESTPPMKERSRKQWLPLTHPYTAAKALNGTSHFAKCRSILCRLNVHNSKEYRGLYTLCRVPRVFFNSSSDRAFLNNNCTQFHFLCHCAILLNSVSKTILCIASNSRGQLIGFKVVDSKVGHGLHSTVNPSVPRQLALEHIVKACTLGAVRANRIKRDTQWLLLKKVFDLLKHKYHGNSFGKLEDQQRIADNSLQEDDKPSTSRDTLNRNIIYKAAPIKKMILQQNVDENEPTFPSFGSFPDQDSEIHVFHSLSQKVKDEVPINSKSISRLWKIIGTNTISKFKSLLNKLSQLNTDLNREIKRDLTGKYASNSESPVPITELLLHQKLAPVVHPIPVGESDSTSGVFSHSFENAFSRPVKKNKERADLRESKSQLPPGPSLTLANTTVAGKFTSTIPKDKRTAWAEGRHPQQHSSSETCRHFLETRLVALPGCLPKTLMITMCKGTCHSRSVPRWNTEDQLVDHVAHCTCCAPNSIVFRNVIFQCPRRRRRVLSKRIGFPFECTCRPCTIAPEVEPEELNG